MSSFASIYASSFKLMFRVSRRRQWQSAVTAVVSALQNVALYVLILKIFNLDIRLSFLIASHFGIYFLNYLFIKKHLGIELVGIRLR